MKYALLVTTLLVVPHTAYAGSYVSLALGTGAEFGGDLADAGHLSKDSSSRSGRLAIGQRISNFAIEGGMYGTSLAGAGDSTLSLGVDAKYHIPIYFKLEGFVRAGLHKTWLADTDSFSSAGSGQGYAVGGGLQVRFNPLPLGEIAVFADYTYQALNFTGDTVANGSGSARMLTLGLSVGL